MIWANCSSIAKLFAQLYSQCANMTVRGSVSRVASVCFPVRGLFSNGSCSFHRAPMRPATLTSVYSTNAAVSLRDFHDKSASRYIASMPRSWTSSTFTVMMPLLRRRSTFTAPAISSLASDVFPKRVTRRTKKKDTERQSQVTITSVLCIVSILRWSYTNHTSLGFRKTTTRYCE